MRHSATHPEEIVRRAIGADAKPILDLQHVVGNRAVTQAVQRAALGVQRYTVVAPGTAQYPDRLTARSIRADKPAKPADEFFVRQEKQAGSFYGPSATPEANLVHSSNVPLRISDNLDLAIEFTTGEAKTFFASAARVKEANAALAGAVMLKTTSRYLRVINAGTQVKLFEVVPFVERPKTTTRAKSKAAGLAVRTPQRCNEMAQFVTGKKGVEFTAIKQANDLVAAVLTKVTGGDWQTRIVALKAQLGRADGNKAYLAFVDDMVQEFEDRTDDDATAGNMEEALQSLLLNADLDPALGSAITTVGVMTATQEETAMANSEDIFAYHFASVVAKSGQDFVTMENYARRDAKGSQTLSGGDPLFFFQMYGRALPGQSWHEKMVATNNFRGAIVSFQVG